MPSVTIWDRIEPRCRANDPAPGLEARVHDPLWLLARQWQVGEFEGRDAGSPVVATVQSSAAVLDRFSVAGQAVQRYGGIQPLETLVEQEAARPSSAAGDLHQAAEAGLYFLRLLAAANLPATIAAAYLASYRLSAPSPAASDVAAVAPAIAGRVIDGIKLHTDLIAAGSSLPAAPAIPQPQRAAVLGVTRAWLQWYSSLFSGPAGEDGWTADRMEYTFSAAAAGDSGSYVAQEYDGGAIDWHTFDRSTVPLAGSTATPVASQRTVVASPVTFRGMPARRFWEMEDGGTNIGLLTAAAEDVGRLLLREFALIYGNDWFQFPLVVPVGSQFLLQSLSVADTFGVATQIPHYSAVDGLSGNWHMFSISVDPLAPPVLSTGAPPQPLLLVPSAVAPLTSSSIEDVLLLRDEPANVAWGIEQTVLGVSGFPLDRTLEWRIAAPAPAPSGNGSIPNYRLGSTVPDYWIPFLPVQIDASGRLQLRRGRLPGSATGPEGRMLGEETSMFLEEVPREGVHLERRYRWARGPDGSGYLWIGRRRTTGRGEGRSGLRFDYIE
ncbi:MAG: hypothetical protein WBL61_11440 [Bryobacteraceae bacterium]